MSLNPDWRDPRPIYEDDRLEVTVELMRAARNKWIDCDFEGKENLAEIYRQEYLRYKSLHEQGIDYVPNF